MGLTPSQQSLVNIGASVGAGCHPCLKHHMEAGAKTGLSLAELQSALTVAETVKRAAVDNFAGLGRQLLGEPEALSSPHCIHMDLVSELVAIGAAIGANDVSQLRRHMAAALQAGLSEADAETCVQLAQTVQRRAAEFTARDAQPTAGLAKTAPASECGPACGCAAPQPAAQTACGGQTRVCGDALRYVKREMSQPPKRAIVSCEGACIKGEVAREAAHLLAYRLERDSSVRICLGEATTGNSGMVDLLKRAPEVIAVEGCPLHCATEILKDRLPSLQTTVVDASQIYTFDRKSHFEVYDLPRSEIEAYADKVARHIVEAHFCDAGLHERQS